MRILKILLILILIVFPFGELLRFNFGNNTYLKPLDIFAGLITIWVTVLFFTKKIKFSGTTLYLWLFPAVGLLSLLINSSWLQPQELLISSLYLVRWISYLGLFLAVAYCLPIYKKTIIPLLILDGFLIVAFGYYQYFFFNSLKPLYFLGWDDHMYRLFSVFLDPNYTGAILVLLIIFIGGLLYKQVTLNAKSKLSYLPFPQVKKKYKTLILSFIFLTTLIALFLTFSRSALLMLIVSGICFFILINRKKLILFMLGVVFIFILIISSKFYVESINLFRTASSVARIENYEQALNIFQKNPLFGVGFNTYRYAKEQNNIQMNWTNNPSHADAGVDNSFLFILVTTGITGLIAYAVLWIGLLKSAFLHYKKDRNIFAIIGIASFAGLFVHALFINSLFFPAIMFWMWILYGLMENN